MELIIILLFSTLILAILLILLLLVLSKKSKKSSSESYEFDTDIYSLKSQIINPPEKISRSTKDSYY